jgi:hypothetical protein
MALVRKNVISLGTVTTGTPSKSFAIGSWDEAIIYVTNPSVSMTVSFQSTPDEGTTWVTEATSTGSATAYTYKVTGPIGDGYGRVSVSAGNSPIFICLTKSGVGSRV